MKAVTLWQPWASLVAAGVKRIETRSWKTSYRGPLRDPRGGQADARCTRLPRPRGMLLPRRHRFARCAARRAVRDRRNVPRAWCDRRPATSSMFAPSRRSRRLLLRPRWWYQGHGVADLYWTELWGRPIGPHPDGSHLRLHPVIPTSERPYGDFTPGRFAWLLDNIEVLAEPIPARGLQKLWEWSR